VRSKPEAPDEDAGSSIGVVLANLRTGVSTIVDTPLLRTLFLTGAPVFFAIGLWNVLLLPMAIKELGATEFEYGLQEGLTSVGFVLGSLFMARYSRRLQTGLWFVIGVGGMGLTGVLYGLSPTILIALPFAILSGFFNSPSAVARQTLLQRATPRELRGRVFSSFFVMRDVIFLAGMAGAGLADIVNVRVLIVAASLILVAVGLTALFVPGIGRPAAEWRRGLAALRAARAGTRVPAPELARPATADDFGTLLGRLATFSRLNDRQRASFLTGATVREVGGGTRVVARGDAATSAWFILDGEAAAGIPDADGSYRGLSTMGAGDFFGEIGALTGSTRTADVVVTQVTTLLEVSTAGLRAAMEDPDVNRLLLSTLTERLLRTNRPDLPRLASMDQGALRELRIKPPTVDASSLGSADG
jgi:CRP-like cAMP-binding protein